MKVRTLDNESFRKECGCLRSMVEESGFIPDLVIAIARGGVFVARELPWPMVSVRLSRPTTGKKKGVLWKILMSLPRFMKDWMRIAESSWLEFREKGDKPPVFTLPEDVTARICSTGCRRILIADDAVDSGKTLLAVLNAVNDCLGSHDVSDSEEDRCCKEVRTAVLTVTRRHPIIFPDYTRFPENLSRPLRTLIRFPWSEDN